MPKSHAQIKDCFLKVFEKRGLNSSNVQQSNSIEDLEEILKNIGCDDLNRELLMCFNYKEYPNNNQITT